MTASERIKNRRELNREESAQKSTPSSSATFKSASQNIGVLPASTKSSAADRIAARKNQNKALTGQTNYSTVAPQSGTAAPLSYDEMVKTAQEMYHNAVKAVPSGSTPGTEAEYMNALRAVDAAKSELDRAKSLQWYNKAETEQSKVDDDVVNLLRQYNAKAAVTDDPDENARLINETDAAKRDAKKKLRALGYSDDQIAVLAEQRGAIDNRDRAIATDEANKKYAADHPIASTLATSALSPAKALGNIESIRSVLPSQIGGYKDADRPTDIYSDLYGVNRYTQAVRGQVGGDLEEKYNNLNIGGTMNAETGKIEGGVNVARFLYDAGTSALDSAVNMAASGVIAEGIAGAGLNNLANAEAYQHYVPKVMNFVMGSEAAADATMEGIQKGYSNEKAFAMGIITGAIEGITEKYSVETIINAAVNDKNILKRLVKSFASEGGEEVASNFLNRLVDIAANADQSEFNQIYNANLEAAGGDEIKALGNTMMHFLGEDVQSFLAGGLSGLAMSGVTEFTSGQAMRDAAEANQAKVTSKVDAAQDAYYESLKKNGLLSAEANEAGKKASAEIHKVTDKAAGGTIINQGTYTGETEYNANLAKEQRDRILGREEDRRNADGTRDITDQRRAIDVRDATSAIETLGGRNASNEFVRQYTDETAKTVSPAQAYAGFSAVYQNAMNEARTGERIEFTEQQKNDIMAIPESMRNAAVRAGKADAQLAMRRVNGSAANVSFKENEVSRQANLSSKDIRTFHAISDVAGVNIEFVESISGVDNNGNTFEANAEYDGDTNTIRISLDAEDPIRAALTHEVVHRIRDISPESYHAMAEFVTKNLRMNAEWANSRYSAEYRGESADTIREEIVADAFGTILANSDVMSEFVNDNRSAARKLKDALHDFVAAINRVVYNRGVMHQSYKVSEVDRLTFTELQSKVSEMEQLLSDALKQAKENIEQAKEHAATAEMGITYDAATESYTADDLLHSRKTWNESDYVQQRNQAAKEMAEALDISQAKAKAYIDNVNSIAKIIADSQSKLDYIGRSLSSFVSNAEYGGSFDFSTICKKRRLMTGTFSEIQKVLKNSALTAEEVLQIRDMMKQKGYEVSCGLCYVEGSRASMGKFSQKFIELYQKYNPDAEWIPGMVDVNTPDGVDLMRVEHPDVYEQYEKFWNNHGKLTPADPNLFASQQKPKLYQLATEYKGEVLTEFKRSDSVKTKNLNGGLRLQSFSDFEIIHLIDCMQVIMDMSRVGLAG